MTPLKAPMAMAWLLLAASHAMAGPTSLYLVPIADIQSIGRGFSYAGASGSGMRGRNAWFNAQEIGVARGVEAGWDSDFARSNVFNFKLSLLNGPKSCPRLAVSGGLMNWSGAYNEPFLAARYDLSHCRIHGGYWKTGGVNRGFLGADFSINAAWSGSVEHLAGANSQTWLSTFYTIPHTALSLDIALGISGTRNAGLQHAFLVYYSIGG
jgi:hypothetical protein